MQPTCCVSINATMSTASMTNHIFAPTTTTTAVLLLLLLLLVV
jgi:hypothetical protein